MFLATVARGVVTNPATNKNTFGTTAVVVVVSGGGGGGGVDDRNRDRDQRRVGEREREDKVRLVLIDVHTAAITRNISCPIDKIDIFFR